MILFRKFKLLVLLLVCIIFLGINTLISFAYTPYSYKIDLDEGVSFIHDTISNYKESGKNQIVNYIVADLNNKDIGVSLVQSNDISSSKQNLLTLLNNEFFFDNRKILGGVNGEFFRISDGQLLFDTISNGEIFSIMNKKTNFKRPIFTVDKNGNFDFDYLIFSSFLKFLDGKEKDLRITSLNKLDSYDNVNISNYKINKDSTYYPHEGLPSRYMLIEVVNGDGSIKAGEEILGKVIEVGEMNIPKRIEKGQLLLTSYGDDNYYKIDYRYLNSPISIKFNIYSESKNEFRNDIITGLTGHEYLIKDNEEMNYDYYKNLSDNNLINNRHARTSLGITGDNKLILFTVDKSNDSLGMTLSELSSMMKYLGAVNAINLDGGGSTSIAFENNEHKLFLMNDPNKYQREIVNSIALTIKNK